MSKPLYTGEAAHLAPPRPQTTPDSPPQTISPDSTRTLIKTLGLLLAGMLGMAALLALLPAAGHDQLWFLLMAERWLHGSALYGPALFDSNTPAIVWLSSLPVLLSAPLHLAVPATAKLCAVLLFAAVALLGSRVLRSLAPTLSQPQHLALLVTFVLITGVLPARDFGQRDQLTALLCLPYVLAAGRRASLPALLASAVGLLAGVGICLKPQQTLVPIAVELALLLAPHRSLRQRVTFLLRPEPVFLLLTGLAFLEAVHHAAPLFFTLTLPTLLSTYWAIGHLTPLQLLAESPELHLLALVTLLFLPRTLRTVSPLAHQLRRSAVLFAVAGIAATLAYYLQGTGWYYQQLPALTFCSAALTLELLLVLHETRPVPLPRWLPAATAALVVLALALTAWFGGLPFTRERAYAITTPDPSFFRALPPGTPVAILTTSVDDAIMPVFRFDLTWSQRTNNLWTLPAILRSTDPQPTDWSHTSRHLLSPARAAQLAGRQRLWMVEDLTRWQPQLVLVARCQDPTVSCQELEDRHDNLLAFFLADSAFRSLWQQHYRFLRSSGPYDAYTCVQGQNIAGN